MDNNVTKDCLGRFRHVGEWWRFPHVRDTLLEGNARKLLQLEVERRGM